MRKNKKGFTLVELVIIISVVAILAAVLILTFSGIIQRAKESSRMQAVTSARDEFFTGSGIFESPAEMEGYIFVIDQRAYKVVNNEIVYDETINVADLPDERIVHTGGYVTHSEITIYEPEGNWWV